MVDQADFAVNLVPPQEDSRETERVSHRHSIQTSAWRVCASGLFKELEAVLQAFT